MSRDPDRIDFTLHVLGEYWRRHPDLRLGQIIGNNGITGAALLIGALSLILILGYIFFRKRDE